MAKDGNPVQLLLETKAFQNYKRIMTENLQHSFPLLLSSELNEAIEWAVKNNNIIAPAILDNNYTKQNLNTNTVKILKYLESKEPIITSSGVLFKKKGEAPNPWVDMIIGFLKDRADCKDIMKTFVKGTKDYAKYDLLQQLKKRNATSMYGNMGAPTSIFYNTYLAEGITRQGRSYIAASVTFFESFLANNIKFNSLNELITFIDNVCCDDKILDDNIYIENNISREQCFFKLMDSVDLFMWIPTEKEMSLVWDVVNNISQQNINRIFYKNNLYMFCDQKIISDLIIKILCSIDNPYISPNEPPKEIVEDLNLLVSILKEYVYYDHIYIDKLARIEYLVRDVVALSDTDSCIISLDAWYRFILDKVYNIDMPIKHRKYDFQSILNKEPKYKQTEVRLDYNFYTDEIIEIHNLKNENVVIPQELLRHAIINIISYVCSNLIVDYLKRYCDIAHSNDNGKCIMVMKNEFEFKSLLLTAVKKNYAAIQERREEKLIPPMQSTQLAITGLAINKSTLPDGIKKQFQDMVYNDILNTENIDQITILKKLAIIEKQIAQSIMNKETIYYMPDNVSPMSSYEDPMTQNGIRAILFYNAVCVPEMPAINIEERNRIFKIKLSINKKNIIKIKDTDPVIYERILKLFDDPIMKDKLETIGFPLDASVPDWVLNFVDIKTIVNNLLSNFPLESIGLYRLQNDFVNYTNIIKL